MRTFSLTLFAFVGVLSLAADDFDPSLYEQIEPMEAKESLATMVVQDGYRLELVANEPMVEEPVLFEFDGNGRMYVAEMLTYMQDADSTGSLEARSRIKRLEDTDGDGVMDRYTIFADDLLLPRMILSLEDGRILVRETNTLDLLLIEDTDGDGISDKRSVYYEGGPRGGNMEHQPSGLIWAMDNWLYETYTEKRYRVENGGIRAESLAYGGGQWGLTQDAAGRLYYSTAGGENPAFGFQFPIVYGKVTVENEQAEGFREVFPIDQTPDVQGGPKRLREDGSLNKFTGVGGQSIYLGDAMPELVGDLFLPEPVGNLIRRAEVIRKDGYTQLTNPYQEERKEFIATTDANFRPVWSGTAPDGGLMFVDMYRGIIQEGNWTKKGSYLRGVIDKYGFDRNIGRGRIYRLTRDGAKYGERPNFYDMTPAEMVDALAHANGWWRTTAQKLIVLSQDRAFEEPLKDMVRTSNSPLGRLHALWALEGLGVLDAKLLERVMLKDKDSFVRAAALRISEELARSGDQRVVKTWLRVGKGKDLEVSQQALLSAYYTEQSEAVKEELWGAARLRHPDALGLAAIEENANWLLQELERRKQMAALGSELAESFSKGQAIFRTLCYTCHGEDGKGVAMPDGSLLAPSLVDSSRINGDVGTLARIVMNGLQGPIEGKAYGGGVMAGMGSNGDEWVADVLTYLRSEFGGSETPVRVEQIEKIAALEAGHVGMWTMEELQSRYGERLENDGSWIVSSSEGSEGLDTLFDRKLFPPWRSSEIMSEGQWIQVEFPTPVLLSRAVLDSSRSLKDYARGYRVELSMDGKDWSLLEENLHGKPVASIECLGFPTRFLKVTLASGSPERRWILHELELYGSVGNE